MGFESLFMESWRLREKILDMFDLTTGGRIIFSVMCVGGVSKDMDSGMLKAIKDTVDDMEKDFRPIMETFLKDYSVCARLKGLGVLTRDRAMLLGAVGPMPVSYTHLDVYKRQWGKGPWTYFSGRRAYGG